MSPQRSYRTMTWVIGGFGRAVLLGQGKRRGGRDGGLSQPTPLQKTAPAAHPQPLVNMSWGGITFSSVLSSRVPPLHPFFGWGLSRREEEEERGMEERRQQGEGGKEKSVEKMEGGGSGEQLS